MSRSRVVKALGLLLLAICSLPWMAGCGSEGSEEETEAALPSYPPGLSADSSPRQVAEVLIQALDEKDGQTLLGLVAIEHGGSEIDAIYQKYGRESDRTPEQIAGLTVSGWSATYAWFQKGATRVTGEQISGDTATVEAQGINPNTGRPRLLQIDLVQENGLWKVKPGLQSREL
jgi:hypothetical protein